MAVWWRKMYLDRVEIVPDGEESRHIPDANCECDPEIGTDDKTGLPVIMHHSFDGREIFEVEEKRLPAAYRGRRLA
ncbi:MAG TPA: hypothetical protein VGO43_14125 [Pyrinomonadaceae bacterium]|nr:hypothetical protein [Pyrinomonadaceae bacterium]